MASEIIVTCSTPNGLCHQKTYIIRAQNTYAIVANSSSVMGRPAETRAMLCMISQLDWTIAKTLVKASDLLRSLIDSFVVIKHLREEDSSRNFPI